MNTPRTDKALQNTGDHHSGTSGIYVFANFARGLERELNAARLELEQARHERNKAERELDKFLHTGSGGDL